MAKRTSRFLGRFLVVATIVLGAASLVVFAVAALDAVEIGRLLAHGVATTGRAVHVEENHVSWTTKYGTGGTSTYVATVRYTDEAGVAHEVSTDGTTSHVTDGERVDVRYQRDDPGRGRAFVSSPWAAPLTGAILGAMTGLLAFVCYAGSRILVRRAP